MTYVWRRSPCRMWLRSGKNKSLKLFEAMCHIKTKTALKATQKLETILFTAYDSVARDRMHTFWFLLRENVFEFIVFHHCLHVKLIHISISRCYLSYSLHTLSFFSLIHQTHQFKEYHHIYMLLFQKGQQWDVTAILHTKPGSRGMVTGCPGLSGNLLPDAFRTTCRSQS